MMLPRFAHTALRKLRDDGRAPILRTIGKDAICAEIGVWKGDFSARIRTAARPRTLHLIDLWRFVSIYPRRWYGGASARNQDDMERIYRDVVRRFADDPSVRIHRLDSASAASHFPNATFDWVYIDADHSYHAVLADLEAWAPKIKPRGMLAGDDYTWRDEDGNLSVERAVQDFTARQSPRDVSVVGGQFLLRL
jgi:Methyltransferase domain